ncbi:hypothetical protein CHU32_08290 [Superficieibacter electus]|uniref:Uncharacterized protein n=1 Tax=Superficieibacter electus TaxID=2022662 RepID=A0A2P5GSU4_9ENTR|nr:hypothetical protein [Superficieibacter electus]POP46898.1 hypothetical protein CHU33_05340 [Superficieibacter electus]POP49635.1 hypothetical protein CHU32_08290 [Superficieibacter electus]
MAATNKQVNLDVRSGDRFECVYPFIYVSTDYQSYDGNIHTDERWIGGCRKTSEPADCGYGDQFIYTADAEGKRTLEVLAVAEMPGQWQRRVIYACHLIDPDGKERKGRKAYTVTETRFIAMSKGYFAEYEVEDIG